MKQMLTREIRADAIWAIFIAIFFTTIVLQLSFRHGRLSMDIEYDDVSYFNDGFERFEYFYENGLERSISNYAKKPPHAPASTLLATVGFLLFGVHDWAPYAMNGCIIVVWLWFIFRSTSPTPRYLQLCFIVFVLTSPLALLAVHEFRPDFASSLFTAMGCVMAVRAGIMKDKEKFTFRLFAGIFFGLSMFCKTSVFPFTLMMMGASVGVSALLEEDYKPRQLSFKKLRAVLLPIVIPALLIPLPHYLYARKRIVRYIWKSMFGENAAVWKYQGTLKESFLYYLNGYGGVMFGKHLFYLVTFCIAVGLILALQKDRKKRMGFVSLAGFVIIAYLFASLNSVKSPFFGLTFQILLFLLAGTGLSLTCSALSSFNFYKGVCILLAFIFCSSIFILKPSAVQKPVYDETTFSDHISTRILATLPPLPSGTSVVYVTTAGMVNANTLQWLCQKQHVPYYFHQAEVTRDLRKLNEQEKVADIVIAAETGVYGQATWHPACQLADVTLNMLRTNAQFKLLQIVETPNGKSFFVFRNDRPNMALRIRREMEEE